ncbi:MAG: TRAP transporter substrate-binding protein [Bacteroidota bacterium]
MFRLKYYFILLLSILFFLQGCKNKPLNETKILRLAHGLDISHPVHKGMEYMAKRVKELSGNKLNLKIYPSEQLGTERQCLEMLQIGSLDITKVSAAVMEGFVPEYRALGMPYLFRNNEHKIQVLSSEIGKEILHSGTNYWLRGLCFYDAGSRSFYTVDKPIRKPSDLKGMKIRVMLSITSVKLVNAMGGSSTPISYGELYTALQNGVVDGAENNPPTFYLSHHYEACKYYSLDQHSVIPDVLLISMHTWNKLSDEEKKWVSQAAEESWEKQIIYWEKSEKESLEAVKKAGVEIIYPDQEPFRKIVQPVYEYFKKRNPKVYELAERIRNFKVDSTKIDSN